MNRKDWEEQVFKSDLNPTAKMVCIAIGSHGNWKTDKTVKPSKQRIAGMVGTSRDTVARYIEALELDGWLKVVYVHKNNVKEYELCAPQVAVVAGILAIKNRGRNPKQVAVDADNLENQVAVDDSLGCRNSQVQVAVDEGQVASIYDTNLKNLQEEPTKEPKTTVADAPVPLGSEPLEDDHPSLTSREAGPFNLTDFEKSLADHLNVRETPWAPEIVEAGKEYYMDANWHPKLKDIIEREIEAMKQAEKDSYSSKDWSW